MKAEHKGERRTLTKDKLLIFGDIAFSGTLRAQQFNEIVKRKEKFIDDLFPPNDNSLYSRNNESVSSKLTKDNTKDKNVSQITFKDKKYIWQRLSDVYKPGELNILKEPVGFKDDPDIICEDVVQGELGDCYFLSAISALAEYPKRIKQLITNINLDKGVIEAQIYLHGEPTKIVIDDYFPFIDKEGYEQTLAFAGFNPETKNIWPLILEKVWAKLNMSYEDIISGNSAEAFEFLSPAPVETFYHDVHFETLYEDILNADKRNYIICSDITTANNTNINYLSNMGLITNHSYTVIDTGELTEPNGKKIRLLKIRNPWGTNEWTGEWSDSSSKWTPEYRKLLNCEEAEDGTYFMDYEDFTKFYTSTHICRIHDDYNFLSNKYPVDNSKQINIVNS